MRFNAQSEGRRQAGPGLEGGDVDLYQNLIQTLTSLLPQISHRAEPQEAQPGRHREKDRETVEKRVTSACPPKKGRGFGPES